MITNKKISVTIPAYNEEETVRSVAEQAFKEVSHVSKNFELLLVNDGSVDKTGIILDSFKKQFRKNIRVIHNKKNAGFSGVLNTCYKNALGDFIFLGPADGQFDYTELKLFVKEMLKGNDIVVAYRTVNQETAYRKINSFLFHLLSRILFGITLKEFSTCMLYKKEVRDSISIYASSQSAFFLPEFFYKAIQKKYKIGQVPIHFYKRKGGRAKGRSIKVIYSTLFGMIKFWVLMKSRREIVP